MYQKSVIFVTIGIFYIGFKFQPYVPNGCHNVLMSINLNDIAILDVRSVDYCCVITGIDKSEVIYLLQNADLTKKRGMLKKLKKNNLVPHRKWVKKLCFMILKLKNINFTNTKTLLQLAIKIIIRC